MNILLDRATLDARRQVAAGALVLLARSLTTDQERVLTATLQVPRTKALLSRAGGRCDRDGTPLDFDPWSPHEHRCPMCGTVHRGEFHDRWWLYPYQLWLAERLVHSAALFATGGDERHAIFAGDILAQYADAYQQYPNRDNVLGPARVFFSTYLDSIWLLQVCVAVDLLETAGNTTVGANVRERIVGPGAALIALYDEGDSNRQVWNNAALLAAYLLLGRPRDAEHVVHGASGLVAHLERGLLDDATWYEGENYHQFAHRGLWYGVRLAAGAGIPLPPAAVARFTEGFAATFATALPDLTLPSRKDSNYRTALRQWRFAESCELGLAQRDDERLTTMLSRLYDGDAPAGDTGRSRSSAEAERNGPAVRLTRADLGWKSLLFANEHLAAASGEVWQSALMEGQGIAVIRRERGSVYVALDYGQSGGGHGHPDRLNVLFSTGPTRWLDDMGTASYVDRSLHWYRSTLAHNAPMVNGRSQWRIDGTLDAFDERGATGWVRARAEIAPGVNAVRSLIVMPEYFIDELRWSAEDEVRFMLPIHLDASPPGNMTLAPAKFPAGDGLEDGAEFVGRANVFRIGPGATVALESMAEGREVRSFVSTDSAALWYTLSGPGQPPTTARRFYVIEQRGTQGTIRSLWSWTAGVSTVEWTADGAVVRLANGHTHRHAAIDRGWQIDLHAGAAHSMIDLTGLRPPPSIDHGADSALRAHDWGLPDQPLPAPRTPLPAAFDLSRPHYRRSEQSWEEAGRPTAHVAIAATHTALTVDIRVMSPHPHFVPADAVNPYDNEPADINGDGVQLYCLLGHGGGAWLLVPDPSTGAVCVREIAGWGELEVSHADWSPVPGGYELRAEIPIAVDPLGGEELGLDIIINETAPGRERRRGQLVLSGAEGEFVYLRGDRHDPARLLHFIIHP